MPTHSDSASADQNTDSIRIAGFSGFERIGSGGFSSVYRATQASMSREVAIKVLSADFASESDRRTFERECHALGLLSRHPNIVTVHSETFTAEGRPCIVMELYRQNYRENLDLEGPLPIPELLSLGVKIAGALQVAHDGGVLHRDIKPHNIFVSDYGEPALGDFGISTLADERSVSGLSGLSVAYAAPEVLEDSRATAHADVYSLAATLYHLAAGTAPFASKQMRATVKRILTEPAAPLSRPDAPPELNQVLLRGLAKEPTDRYESAERFGAALRDVQASIGLDRTVIPLRRSGGTSDPMPNQPGKTAGRWSAESTVARKPPEREPSQVSEAPPAARERSASGGGRAAAVSGPNGPTGRHRPSSGAADSPADIDRDDGEHTIRRERQSASIDAPSQSVKTEHGPSTTRRNAAVLLGSLAVVAVVMLGFMVTRSGQAESTTTTTAVTVAGDPDEQFFDLVSAPSGIVISGEPGGSSVEISFESVDGATSYEAESVAPSTRSGRRASSPSSVITADVSIDDAPCWVVRTIGQGGRQSADSVTVCAE